MVPVKEDVGEDASESGKARSSLLFFREERATNRLMLITALIITILKGLRLPSSWPATQAQIDYRSGFLRRGLLGEAFRQLHIPIWRYSIFTLVSFVLLAAFLFLLAWSVRRSGLDSIALGSFATLLAGSFCLSMLVSLVGFYDIPMAILALLVLLIPNPRLQLLAAMGLGVTGVFVHELYAITFLPISLTGAIYWATEPSSNEQPVRRKRKLRGLLFLACAMVPCAVVLIISSHAMMTLAQVKVLQGAVRARVDFVPYDAMLEVLARSGSDNFHLMLTYIKLVDAWVEEAFGLIAYLPTTCFFLAVAFRISAKRSKAVRAWFVLCTFSPLLLDFQGFDYYRWVALMNLNAILCVISALFAERRFRQGDAGRQERAGRINELFGIEWRRAAGFLLAINLATNVGFFGSSGKNFPFREYAIHFHALEKTHRSLLRPPGLFPVAPHKP